MRYHCVLCVFILLCQSLIPAGNRLFAVVDQTNSGAIDAIVDGPIPVKVANLARVRIPVKLLPYHKVIVKDSKGELRERYITVDSMSHNLRARIERINHFYVSDWHIESIPQSWDKGSGKYQVRLRFYQVYGDGRELEEFVGSLAVNAVLKQNGETFSFNGYAADKFKNKLGNNVLDVEIGMPAVIQDKALISRKVIENPTR